MENGRSGYIYVLTNKYRGTLYIGSTENLKLRVFRHKRKQASRFTSKYNLNKLVYFFKLPTIEQARIKEKQMKKWNREWKIKLIETVNPGWIDLSKEAVADGESFPSARE